MDTTTAASSRDGNRQAGIIVTTIVVTVLADFVVGLRMMVRKWVVKNIGWDDWTIVAAVVSPAINILNQRLTSRAYSLGSPSGWPWSS